MAEFTMDEATNKFASKGKGNAALTLGVIGTALGGLGILGKHVGAGNCDAAGVAFNMAYDDRFVGKDLFWQQNVNLEKEFGQARYDALKHNYELYVNLDAKNSALATKMAQLEASLPLAIELNRVNGERYTDDRIAKVDKQICMGALVTQAALDKKIDGQMGLPWSSIISGIPKMPRCTVDVTCPSNHGAM